MVAFVQLAENISSSILAELNIPLIVVDKTSTVLYANRAFVESADDGGDRKSTRLNSSHN